MLGGVFEPGGDAILGTRAPDTEVFFPLDLVTAALGSECRFWSLIFVKEGEMVCRVDDVSRFLVATFEQNRPSTRPRVSQLSSCDGPPRGGKTQGQ